MIEIVAIVCLHYTYTIPNLLVTMIRSVYRVGLAMRYCIILNLYTSGSAKFRTPPLIPSSSEPSRLLLTRWRGNPAATHCSERALGFVWNVEVVPQQQ